MSIMLDVRRLVEYIDQIPNFYNSIPLQRSYGHIGATITDAILQAGLSYEKVVTPRVQFLLDNHPEAKTSVGFIELINQKSFNRLINFNNEIKINRIKNTSVFFFENEVNTEKDLYSWMLNEDNCFSLLTINGIGLKTVDYLKNLVGIPAVAVDRHVRSFVADAGVARNSYEEIKTIVEYAADISNLSRSSLDKLIWKYMSNRRQLELDL